MRSIMAAPDPHAREVDSMWRVPALVASFLLAPVASAQDFTFGDDDEFLFDGEEPSPQPAPERLDEADDLHFDDDDLPEDLAPAEPGDEIDLLGDEPAPVLRGGDTADLYRQRQLEYGRLSLDEEVASWEAYLAEFPHTPFAERIQQRIDTLMDSLYSQRIERRGGEVDAMHREIGFTQPLLLENLDPRTRLRVGIEMGLPDWFNPYLDYEHAFLRNLSAHIGLRKRYTGTSIEPGLKYAVVKSTRTNTLVTLMADFRFNAAPTAFPGVRPMVGVGKRFGEKLDVQVQAGTEMELHRGFDLRFVGGLSANYRASQTVGIFAETGYSLKNIGGQAGIGYFNVLTFGMKFFPSRRDTGVNENIQVDMGASVPYSTNYYAFHYGSILGQANIFFD